jgi:peptidoglycan hydrolase CwlO-like protein
MENLKEKLDALMNQVEKIQNEMSSLQEQQDGSNNLVRKICIFDHFDIHY